MRATASRHARDVGVGQPRVQRQRQQLARGARPRPGSRPAPDARERRLLRERHRIVDQRLDAGRAQMRLQRVALRAMRTGKQMVDVPGVALGDRREPGRQALRDSAAASARRRAVRCGQPRQPRAQDRRLQLVEPAVDAGLDVVVAVGLPAVAQPPDALGERRVVGDDGAAVAERAEVLRRIEAEGAADAARADRDAAARSRGAPGSSPRRRRARGAAATRADASHVGRPGRRDAPARSPASAA